MKRFLYRVATDQIQGGGVALVKIVLWFLSWVYRFFVMLWTVFYNIGILKKSHLSSRVISIGNLTVGGVGKTPLVEFIAKVCQSKNLRAVILTRGYMGNRTANGRRTSDEALMLEKELAGVPVLVGSDRVQNAQSYLKHNNTDVFLLDDGFQHLRLSRDLDIVAIDATNPWGNGYLLPRGILREPKSALKRAHMFILTKTDLGKKHLPKIKEDLKLISPGTLIIETIHQPICLVDARSGKTVDWESVREKRICAVSSIGSPDSFAQTLKKLGADIGKHFSFMDHHTYKREDVVSIGKTCLNLGITKIVTTEKDCVKLQYFFDAIPDQIRIHSLKIRIVITNGEEKFLERISAVL